MTNRTDNDKSEQLLWLGLYDNQTNLPNRYLFLDRLHHIKRQAAREKYEFSVLMIQLCDLPHINKQYGYDTGDKVLITVAERLKALARDSDTVARFGGDEFTVILRNVNRLEDAELIADKYVEAVNTPITIAERTIRVNVSIGISCYPNHSEDINELLHQAEKAMRACCEEDRRYSVYSEEYKDSVADNLYNYDIDQIFRDEDIRFKYQPVCRIDTKEIVSAEALCRWNHPVLGEIVPGNLIFDANNSPVIKSFVSNSLRFILQQIQDWKSRQIELPVHFNLSAYMLNDPLTVDLIKDLLSENNVAASSLVLELTETEFYSMDALTISVIQELAEHGVKIALDDFGVGFSSMSHLLEFPVDLLKVDKLFVENIHINDKARIITEALINMAHQLGAKVVAEGVDHPAAIQLLQQLDCDFIQSHSYYRPLSVEEIEQQLGRS